MSTFETLTRDLATRFDLGNQATPFLRMLMAHMTNPDKGGLPGFVQSLRSAGWNTLDSWLGRADLATNATEEHIERAFGHNGGLIGNMLMAASETLAKHSPLVNNGEGPVLPELKDIQTVSRAIAFAVPALLGRLTPGGTVPTVLPPEATTYIGDRREWIVSATAVAAAPVAAARGGMGWLPWVIAALVAALRLGWCAMQKKPADMPAAPATPASTTDAPATPTTPAPSPPVENTVPAPSGTTPPPSVQATEEPAGAGILAWRLDDMPALKVYFDSGSTTITPEFNDKAKDLVDYLAANSGANAAISGFNDPTGNPVKNAELSKNRAQAVQAALVSAGVAADRLQLRKPADTTGTAATNAASSRVEVTVFK